MLKVRTEMSTFLCFCLTLVYFLLSLGSHTAQAKTPPELDSQTIQAFAKSKKWRQLLYYKGEEGDFESLVVSPEFFISQEGRHNPLAELTATIELFKQERAATNTHPQCRFPARYQVLRKAFELAPPVTCPDLSQWLDNYQPKSVSYVYASQYVSNPASVFGHAFFLIGSDTASDYLNVTVNYAATVPKDINGFSYAYNGLTGGFVGEYSFLPFYQRLYQYNDVESRDLWIYRLKLPEKTTDLLILHLWELVHGGARMQYYFIDENCASALLAAIEAVSPDLALTEQLPIYAPPGEVTRILHASDLIADVEFRPSLSDRLNRQIAKLNNEQTEILTSIIEDPEGDYLIQDVLLAETAMDYLSFIRHENKGELPAKYKSLERSVYIARADMGLSHEQKLSQEVGGKGPHLGHAPWKASLGQGWLNETGSLEISIRSSVHGFMEPDQGYLANSEIAVLEGRVILEDYEHWHLDELRLASLTNIQPIRMYKTELAWFGGLEVKRNRLIERNGYFGFLEGGVGAAFEFKRQHTFYLMANAEGRTGAFEPFSRLELGPKAGYIFRSGKGKLTGEAQYLADAKTGNATSLRAGIRLSYFLSSRFIVEGQVFTRDLVHADQRMDVSRIQLGYFY